ncbi:MAG: PIG-L family deacetylase [Acidobacteriaceae bacterium]|nr:PIG-L family deacetylase [Acidobacteriaceae bacterium]MBV9296580.1 PIG-L family deacetylase [Acidobacteriaceae bacterium]MBV9763827.1 PIG-L family deacetylase [Acidobacteriaceae bacterium]
MNSYLLWLCLVVCLSIPVDAQSLSNPKPDARYKADLLVVVAHPDDETEIGAYLARAIFDEKKRVAVVFGNRGNTGGNAQGQEQAAALGDIREIEARRALAHFGVMNVWFLNGIDTPGQNVLDSLEIWDHGSSLDRLVRLVRLTRPAVIATWLPDWVAGENHGDHQAAGVLATEAFDMAADPTVFAEQLSVPKDRQDINNLTEGLHPWQPEKLYYFSDAAHTDFLKGKGPAYVAKENSPSRHESYARLAAEECAYHLTQGDSGQMAAHSLATNDLHYFEQPVLFIFGKSYVKSGVTDDLFAGIIPDGIAYQRPPGFQPEKTSGPAIELGGSWSFYRQFWKAHGLDHLAGLIGPEIMANYASRFIIPVLLENPTDTPINVNLSVALPEGWTFMSRPEPTFSVPSHEQYSYIFAAKTPSAETSGWRTIAIEATSNQQSIGQIHIRVELDHGAMPQGR